MVRSENKNIKQKIKTKIMQELGGTGKGYTKDARYILDVKERYWKTTVFQMNMNANNVGLETETKYG